MCQMNVRIHTRGWHTSISLTCSWYPPFSSEGYSVCRITVKEVADEELLVEFVLWLASPSLGA